MHCLCVDCFSAILRIRSAPFGISSSYFASKAGGGIGPLKVSVMILFLAVLFGIAEGFDCKVLLGEDIVLCRFFFFDKVLNGGLYVFTGYRPVARNCA